MLCARTFFAPTKTREAEEVAKILTILEDVGRILKLEVSKIVRNQSMKYTDAI